MLRWLVSLLLSLTLLGCQSAGYIGLSEKPKNTPDQLVFIDITQFDSDMETALSSSQQEVNVSFYEKVSPNSTPERLQKWLSAVEKNGGKVRIQPLPGELVARDPFSLIGMLGSLWNVIKMGGDFSKSKMFDSARGRDAVISLERNSKNEIVISNIAFKHSGK